MSVKAYIFDIDGTLIDSMGGWWKVLPQFLDERGISYPPDLMKRIIALGLPGVAHYYKENFPVQETEEEILQHIVATFKKKYAEEFAAKPHAKETLLALKARGVKVCALTAGMHVLFDDCLKRLGLWEILDERWSSDDFPVKKSEPAIYQMAAERLGVSVGECVMVDDSPGAIRPAKEAGMQTAAIYDEYSKQHESEMRELADRYIYDLQELI